MNFTLMHKNHPVIEMNIDSVNGRFVELGQIYEYRRLPIGTCKRDESKEPDIYSFERWWKSRIVPLSRQGLGKALQKIGLNFPEEIAVKGLGLSLTDQYWIKPYNKNINWEDVNYFDNDFSEELGELLFGERISSDKLNMQSPDSFLNGWLRKKWKISEGKRLLVKGGSDFQQQPYNEVIASDIADRLGLSHVKYQLAYTKSGHPISICENMINRDTELIPAAFLNMEKSFSAGDDKYRHFCKCCESLHIPDYKNSLDEMLVLDFLIANEDRHMGNFGAIREAESLEFISLAPIYDCGSSLRFDTPDASIDPALDVEAQPFRSRHSEQIKLVSNIQRFNLKALKGLPDTVYELFSDTRYTAFMKASRPDKIMSVLDYRIKEMNKCLSKQPSLWKE